MAKLGKFSAFYSTHIFSLSHSLFFPLLDSVDTNIEPFFIVPPAYEGLLIFFNLFFPVFQTVIFVTTSRSSLSISSVFSNLQVSPTGEFYFKFQLSYF